MQEPRISGAPERRSSARTCCSSVPSGGQRCRKSCRSCQVVGTTGNDQTRTFSINLKRWSANERRPPPGVLTYMCRDGLGEKASGSPGAIPAIRLFDFAVLSTGFRPGLATAATGAAVGASRAAGAFSAAAATARAADRTDDRQVGVAGVCVDSPVEGIRARCRARGAALVRVRGVAATLVVGAVGVGFSLGSEAQVEVGVTVVARRGAGHRVASGYAQSVCWMLPVSPSCPFSDTPSVSVIGSFGGSGE